MKTPYGDILALPDDPAIEKTLNGTSILEVITRELLFFKIAGYVEGYEGPGRYHHAVNAANAIWRQKGKEEFVWHPWMEEDLRAYCESDEVIITGPASGGKTTAAAMFAVLFWICSPNDTACIITSTTRDGLRRRIWSEIRKFYLKALPTIGQIGRLVDSEICIQSYKGATQHGIFGIAVAQGEEQKAIGRIIGFHPRRLFVAADELTDMSWAIVESLTNLFTGVQKGQFAGIGNAALVFDSHGKMCEPKEGWASVNVEMEQWPTKRGGLCVHHDGFKCENVIQGRKIYPFLLTQEDIDRTAQEYGMDSPQMWRMRRGYWCPEGTSRTVLSDSLITKFNAMHKAVWQGATQMWAGLDPAFEGGDRCVLRFAKTGKTDSGIEAMELQDMVFIKTKVNDAEPLHYQIARQVRAECMSRGVRPENFAMDVTGEGGGLAAIIAQEWGAGFHQVEFGGRASDMPVSDVNPRPCHQEYGNRVTELWYAFRSILMLNRVRGLDADTALEFCKRQFRVESKIWVESKRDMKARPGGRSPDLADAVVTVLDLVKRRGALGRIQTDMQIKREIEWNKLHNEYADDDNDSFTVDGIEALM